MAGNKSSESVNSPPAVRGEYQPPSKTDVRGPCPIVNSLANHGYINRSGKNVTSAEMYKALQEIGVGTSVNAPFCYGGWLEHYPDPPKTWWAMLTGPFAYAMRQTAMRPVGQIDSDGIGVLHLDQLAIHGQIEHDVSLSRRDIAQGDNITKQEDLIADMIATSSDGRMMTAADWGKVRQNRLDQQRRDNPQVNFPSMGQTVAATEIALIQTIFGLSDKAFDIPVAYLKAIFEDERLPVQEGWRRRGWWGYLGIVELVKQTGVMRKHLGDI